MSKKSRERKERVVKMLAAKDLLGVVSRGTFYDYICRSGVDVDGRSLIIPSCEVFDLQNIVDELEQRKEGWSISGLVSRPPFDDQFFEWRERGMRIGAFVFVDRCELKTEVDSETKHLIHVVLFILSPFSGQVHCIGRAAEQVDDQWQHILTTTYLRPNKNNQMTEQEKQNWLASQSGKIIFALGLLNCRNVVTVKTPPSQRDNEIHEREFGTPITTSKRLAIRFMSKRYERGDGVETGDIRALHIRRGNFAHYGDDAPLFGKYTGTFWREATVVGKAKHGIVNKDYKVQP